MQQAVLQFIERMALICEKEGMPRIAGRIFGCLLASDRTYSLEELAEHLQASKASVSTNARMLEQFGMIQRKSVMGDRRDFYRVEDDPWERMLRVAQGRWRDMANTFAEARDQLPDPAGRRRVAEAERFHRLLISESDAVIERWNAARAVEAGSATDSPSSGTL